MTRRLLITASILALTAGCSSSSSGTTPGNDSGTTSGGDSSTSGGDSSASDDGGTTDTGTVENDTGTTMTGDTGTTGGDAGACVAATTVTVPPYTDVTARSACTGAQIADFITACAGSGTQTTCAAWAAMAANATCNDCIAPAPDSGLGENSGALLFDSAGSGYLNTPGCLQIKDGNSNCAAPLEELWLCEDDSCDSVACQAASSTDQQACQMAADSLGCTAQATAAQNAAQCGTDFGDGGAASICNPATIAGFAGVIQVICDANGM